MEPTEVSPDVLLFLPIEFEHFSSKALEWTGDSSLELDDDKDTELDDDETTEDEETSELDANSEESEFNSAEGERRAEPDDFEPEEESSSPRCKPESDLGGATMKVETNQMMRQKRILIRIYS